MSLSREGWPFEMGRAAGEASPMRDEGLRASCISHNTHRELTNAMSLNIHNHCQFHDDSKVMKLSLHDHTTFARFFVAVALE
jgi:hypothetical protein